MGEETDRPQDVGRDHGRRRGGRTASEPLIDRYHATMRAWLARTLDALDGTPQPDGLHGPVPPKRPDTAEAIRLWDLGMKLGRELGSNIDPTPPDTGRSGRLPRTRKLEL